MIDGQGANQRWSVDFVHDVLAGGRRFRVFAVVDDISRECLALVVDTSISGARGPRHFKVRGRFWQSRPICTIVQPRPSIFGHDLRADAVDEKSLSERDICTKFITPAVCGAGWDEMSQIREEVSFTKGRIAVRDKLVKACALLPLDRSL